MAVKTRKRKGGSKKHGGPKRPTKRAPRKTAPAEGVSGLLLVDEWGDGSHEQVCQVARIGASPQKPALPKRLAASVGRLDSVTMITRKPPGGLKGSPGVTRSGVDLDAITEATELFDGPVMEGFSLFPANVNVSAAVSMAGIGPHKTRLQVIADPAVTRNTHDIVAEGEFGLMRFHIENVPSEENPRTGRLTALSVLAYLKQLTSPLHLGV